ncbi:MAG: hypothetical protein ABSH06_03140 [Thermodesulfobacteriota bacterium]
MNDKPIPRLNQCFLCKRWDLEKNLFSIEVPDQAGCYIKKLGCQECIDEIMGRSALQDKPEGGESRE